MRVQAPHTFDFSHKGFGRERNSQGASAEREDVAIFLEPAMGPGESQATLQGGWVCLWFFGLFCVNDPSAGSPTETLLRLLLPLDEQICMTLGNRSTTEVVSRPLSERLIDSSNR